MELNFKTGEVILVYGEMDEDGFYMGELDGVRGLVPSNFLTEAPEPYSNQAGAASTSSGLNSQRSQCTANIPLNANQRNIQPTGPGARGPPPPPREIGSIGKLVPQKGSIGFFNDFANVCKRT